MFIIVQSRYGNFAGVFLDEKQMKKWLTQKSECYDIDSIAIYYI